MRFYTKELRAEFLTITAVFLKLRNTTTGQNMNDPLLRLSEVATRLSISLRKVQYLIADNDLSSIRMGPKTVRVKESELNRFIEAGSTNATN